MSVLLREALRRIGVPLLLLFAVVVVGALGSKLDGAKLADARIQDQMGLSVGTPHPVPMV